MRLVVDVNLAPAWIPFLIAAGHDAIHWRDIGALDAPDSEIADWARRIFELMPAVTIWAVQGRRSVAG